MPKMHPDRDEMIKEAFVLYLKYNGTRFDQIEQDMHRLGFVGFKRSMLKDKGNGENYRAGWITQFGWENSLRLQIATSQAAAATSAESLLMENEVIRKAAFIEIQTQGVRSSKEIVWQHNTYTQNCIKILDKLEAARDNYSNFIFFLQHLLKASTKISPALAKEICDAEDALVDWAEKEFVTEDAEDPEA